MGPGPFDHDNVRKLLIANRGEIAVRIARACREMGVSPIAVYSDCDRTALHVRMADEAYPIGPSPPGESYLRIDRILDAARRSGADAVHPGYGFLAENEAFASAVRDSGLAYVGPSPEAIAVMGSKTAARVAAGRAGVPVVPGTDGPLGVEASDAELVRSAEAVGYPLLVKAVAGGGGKGMRTVGAPEHLPEAVRAARSEAATAFGDSAVYLERRLSRPRHVEIQLLGDHYGAIIPFVERECSIQRRHQKVVEETPSPVVTPEVRRALTTAAVAVARAVNYANAGTVEFLLDEDHRFYFLEMNTRLQVEHPVTEMVTGVDLVQWQMRITRGDRLTLDAGRLLVPQGHAVECRIYAEDPDNGFLPSPGRVQRLQRPDGPGIRDDSGITAGMDVPIFYDPLISKLAAWAPDRAGAIARMRRALREYQVDGIRTTIPFFLWLLDQPDFCEGRFGTTYLDDALSHRDGRAFLESAPEDDDWAVVAAVLQSTMVAGGGQARTADAGRGSGSGGWKSRARAEGLR